MFHLENIFTVPNLLFGFFGFFLLKWSCLPNVFSSHSAFHVSTCGDLCPSYLQKSFRALHCTGNRMALLFLCCGDQCGSWTPRWCDLLYSSFPHRYLCLCPRKFNIWTHGKASYLIFIFHGGQTWIRTIVQLTPGLAAWALLQGHEHWCQLKGCGFLFHNQDCFFWERGNNNKATENKSGASPLSIALTFCSSRSQKGLEKWKRYFSGVSTEEIHCRGGGIIKQDFQMKAAFFFFFSWSV